MTTKHNLLLLLQRGTFSGSQLATQLNVSRNAVWKAIQSLNQSGYTIVSQPDGYQLLQTPLHLDETLLQSQLIDVPVYFYNCVESTNTCAKIHAQTHDDSVVLFIAKAQTHGKGRYQKSFYSPENSGIYMTLLYQASHLSDVLTRITPLCAVAVYKAIQDVLNIAIDIKWINDLFLNNKKIGGILTEAITSVEIGKLTHLVIGIGLNVTQPHALPDELRDVVGYLSDETVDFNRLAVAIVNHLIALLKQLPNCDFFDDYKKRCFILNQFVTVRPTSTKQPYIAKAIDITNDGFLIVQKEDNTTEVLHFGDVSLTITP